MDDFDTNRARTSKRFGEYIIDLMKKPKTLNKIRLQSYFESAIGYYYTYLILPPTQFASV